MNQQIVPAARPAAPRPIATPAEAQQVIGHLSDVMDALLGVIEQETKLVRAGRLSQVTQLERKKTDLARLYLADTARLQASGPYLAKTLPAVLAEWPSRSVVSRRRRPTGPRDGTASRIPDTPTRWR